MSGVQPKQSAVQRQSHGARRPHKHETSVDGPSDQHAALVRDFQNQRSLPEAVLPRPGNRGQRSARAAQGHQEHQRAEDSATNVFDQNADLQQPGVLSDAAVDAVSQRSRPLPNDADAHSQLVVRIRSAGTALRQQLAVRIRPEANR